LHEVCVEGNSEGEALPVCSHAFLFRLQKGDELEEGVTSEGKQRCLWLRAVLRLVRGLNALL